MGKKELTDEIKQGISEPSVVQAEELDTIQKCAVCGKEMPYEKYNDKSPQANFISHVIPGADEFTPGKRLLYCSIQCFMNEMEP